MVRMPSPLKADRLSQAFCGTESVTVYPASDVFAFANGCADAGAAVTPNARTAITYARIRTFSFVAVAQRRMMPGRKRSSLRLFHTELTEDRVTCPAVGAGPCGAGTWIARVPPPR